MKTENIVSPNFARLYPWARGITAREDGSIGLSHWKWDALALCESLLQFRELFHGQISEMAKDLADNTFQRFMIDLAAADPELHGEWRFIQETLDATCHSSIDSTGHSSEEREEIYQDLKQQLMRALYGTSEPGGVIQSSGIAQGHAKFDAYSFFSEKPDFALLFNCAVIHTFSEMQRRYLDFKRRALSESLYAILKPLSFVLQDINKINCITNAKFFRAPFSIDLPYAETIHELYRSAVFKNMLSHIIYPTKSYPQIIDTICSILENKPKLKSYFEDSLKQETLKEMALTVKSDLEKLDASYKKSRYFLAHLGRNVMWDVMKRYLDDLSHTITSAGYSKQVVHQLTHDGNVHAKLITAFSHNPKLLETLEALHPKLSEDYQQEQAYNTRMKERKRTAAAVATSPGATTSDANLNARQRISILQNSPQGNVPVKKGVSEASKARRAII